MEPRDVLLAALVLGGLLQGGAVAAQGPVRSGDLFSGYHPPAVLHPVVGTGGRFHAEAPFPGFPDAGRAIGDGDGRGVQVFVSSLLASSAGWLGGAFVGAVIATDGDGDIYSREFVFGVLAGGALGSSLGAALAGNLADGPPGTFGKRLLVAGGVGVAGTLIGVAAGAPVLVFAVPVMETLAMVIPDYR